MAVTVHYRARDGASCLPPTMTHRYGSKHYNHPLVGDITVLHEATQLAEGDQYLLLYAVGPGSPSEDAMHLLESMVATQAEQEPSNLLLA